MNHPSLSTQLAGDEIVTAPGVYDALSAVLAEQAGFAAAYLSGASIAYCRFGRPDIGLVGMSEVAETLSTISERTELPLIVDADTGYGNALNVQRTVRLFEQSGANAIQLEDQTLPKRCGHLAGKVLVPPGEMAGKIKAATDARRTPETLIVARTDAIAVEGFEAALDRADAYLEAGADVLFVEAPRDPAEMQSVVSRFQGRAPLLANMVEGGKTPLKSASELQAMGFSIVIFPGGLVRTIARTAQDYFASLKAHGTNDPMRERMFDFDQLNELLGTADMLEAGAAYDAANFEDRDD